MKLSRAFGVGLLACLAALGGCGNDDGNDSDGSKTPSVAVVIDLRGGSGAGLAGRSGGDGGWIFIDVQAGRLLPDDGRARPTIATNLLSAPVMADNVVTYAELITLAPPVVAADIATFTLTGTGLHLPSNVRMDLSDAPYTGLNPATDVLSIVIVSDSAVRLDGNVMLSRVGPESLHFSLTTSHADGISFDGRIDASAALTRDGGDVALAATNGPIIAGGRILSLGGNATTTLNAGHGGDVLLIAGLGDLVLDAGLLRGNGGAGDLAGGTAGSVDISVQGGAAASFGWGIDANGGASVTGAAGDGGDISISYTSPVAWAATLNASGGASNAGAAGDGGTLSLGSPWNSGRLVAVAGGGSSETGAGGSASGLELAGTDHADLLVDVDVRGGAGQTGGNGAEGRLALGGVSANITLLVKAQGGRGLAAGGLGGSATIRADSGAVLLNNVRLEGDVRGGDGGTTGGSGGSVLLQDSASASLSGWSIVVQGDARGGNGGTTGGSGGGLGIIGGDGSLTAEIRGNVNGGASATGGGATAGNVVVDTATGSLELVLGASAIGGPGTGGTGGDGGNLQITSADALRVSGFFSGFGGSSSAAGGVGGTVLLNAGPGGMYLATVSINVSGGQGASGGGGGLVEVLSQGGLVMDGGRLDATGGVGSTTSGGLGGVVWVATQDDSLVMAGSLRALGGQGTTAGGAGGLVRLESDAGGTGNAGAITVHQTGTVVASGGLAPASGAGGAGGTIELLAQSADAGPGGNVFAAGTMLALGGSGSTGGAGGNMLIVTDDALVELTGTIVVNAAAAGNGGQVAIGDIVDGIPGSVVVAATARVLASGAGTGLAGMIEIDADGAGPNNPNLLVQVGAVLTTNDGNGTDQSAMNVLLD